MTPILEYLLGKTKLANGLSNDELEQGDVLKLFPTSDTLYVFCKHDSTAFEIIYVIPFYEFDGYKTVADIENAKIDWKTRAKSYSAWTRIHKIKEKVGHIDLDKKTRNILDSIKEVSNKNID